MCATCSCFCSPKCVACVHYISCIVTAFPYPPLCMSTLTAFPVKNCMYTLTTFPAPRSPQSLYQRSRELRVREGEAKDRLTVLRKQLAEARDKKKDVQKQQDTLTEGRYCVFQLCVYVVEPPIMDTPKSEQ